MNDTGTSKGGPSKHRWMWLSLGLNVFLLGVLLGGMPSISMQAGGTASGNTSSGNTSSGPSVRLDGASTQSTTDRRVLRDAAEGLGSDRAKEFRDAIRQARRGSTEELRTIRDGRAEVVELLNQPNFDRAAFAKALDRVRDSEFTIRTRIERRMTEFAAGLSAEERARLRDGLMKTPRFRAQARPARAAGREGGSEPGPQDAGARDESN